MGYSFKYIFTTITLIQGWPDRICCGFCVALPCGAQCWSTDSGDLFMDCQAAAAGVVWGNREYNFGHLTFITIDTHLHIYKYTNTSLITVVRPQEGFFRAQKNITPLLKSSNRRLPFSVWRAVKARSFFFFIIDFTGSFLISASSFFQMLLLCLASISMEPVWIMSSLSQVLNRFLFIFSLVRYFVILWARIWYEQFSSQMRLCCLLFTLVSFLCCFAISVPTSTRSPICRSFGCHFDSLQFGFVPSWTRWIMHLYIFLQGELCICTSSFHNRTASLTKYNFRVVSWSTRHFFLGSHSSFCFQFVRRGPCRSCL